MRKRLFLRKSSEMLVNEIRAAYRQGCYDAQDGIFDSERYSGAMSAHAIRVHQSYVTGYQDTAARLGTELVDNGNGREHD